MYLYRGWTLTPSVVDVQSCKEPVKPTAPVSTNPLEMFSIIFDGEVLDLIVMGRDQQVCKSSAGREWNDLGDRCGGDHDSEY